MKIIIWVVSNSACWSKLFFCIQVQTGDDCLWEPPLFIWWGDLWNRGIFKNSMYPLSVGVFKW